MITRKVPKNAPPVEIERGADHVVIRPRNLLKAKAAVLVEGKNKGVGFDDSAIRRAELALKALSVNFNGWMEESSRALAKARDDIRERGASDGRAAALYRVAHDMRGQATTLGFPLAARVAASLSRLLEELSPDLLHGGALTPLVDQHVDAVRAIVREGVSKAKQPTGEALTIELEAITERLISGQPKAALH
jgi:hypothetical protein